MDHEAYETQMFETVNQHGEEAAGKVIDAEWSKVVNKNDARVVATGLKRTLLALLTAATFFAAVVGFIATAKAPGYLAVGLFFASILALLGSFVLLYAQGLTPKLVQESKGDNE